MSNKAVHTVLGGFAGGVIVAQLTQRADPRYQFISVISGVIGGVIGGRLPDRIDPPTSPNHRAIEHSFVLAALAASPVWNAVQDWSGKLPVRHPQACSGPNQQADAVTHLDWSEVVKAVLVGLGVGLAAGYASHLVADFGTSRGLPLG